MSPLKLLFIALFLWPLTLFSTVFKVNSAEKINAQKIHPGDTILFQNGNWRNQKIILKGKGTEASPIVLKAEEPGKVFLMGDSSLKIDGIWLVVEGFKFNNGYSVKGPVIEFSKASEHCRLTQTSIINFNPPEIKIENHWISIYGIRHRVDNCYFAGKTNIGTTLVVWLSENPNYDQIDHNYFGERPLLGENGGETIRVGNSTWSMYDSFTLVEHNYFERCNGEIEIISNKSCHNTYRFNTFYECQGTLTLRHGNFGEVYGNFFLGNNQPKTGGIRIIGEDHKVYNNYFQDLTGKGFSSAISVTCGVPDSPLNRYFQVKRAQIVANTIANCVESLEIGSGFDAELTLLPLDCTIANNIIQADKTKVKIIENPTNLSFVGNLVSVRLLEMPALEGMAIEKIILQKTTDGMWRPAKESPAIGAFKGEFNFVTEDIDKQARRPPKDVGADQVSQEPVLNKPINESEAHWPFWLKK